MRRSRQRLAQTEKSHDYHQSPGGKAQAGRKEMNKYASNVL